MKLPSWAWRAWHRSHNRWLDLVAKVMGACNASTWDPLRKQYGPGYSHWRCMRRHEHAGPHRFNNYIWWYGSRGQFDPLPATPVEREADPRTQELTHQRWTAYRHGIMPHGRERAFRREMELQRRIRSDAARAVWGEGGVIK